MKNTVLLILLCSVISCSHISQNFVTTSEMSFYGGKLGNESWDDALEFKRATWHWQVTSLFDVMVYKVDNKSPFYKWFSESEQKDIERCTSFVVALSDSNYDQKISKRMFITEMEKNSFTEYTLVDFSRNMASHPEFNHWAFRNYRITGFCSKSKNVSNTLAITFPNYKTEDIEL